MTAKQRHVYLCTGFRQGNFSLTLHAIADSFTGVGVDEAALFHLEYGMTGAGFAEYGHLIAGGGVALALCGALLVALSFTRQARQTVDRRILAAPFVFLALAIAINPSVHSMFRHYWFVQTTSPFAFHYYYRTPYATPTGETRKNLVFLYAESLERTYFDEEIFPGLITGLRALEARSTSFTGISQIDGTGWTVAGLTASLLGIPLFTTSHGNSMSGMDQFLPSAVGLGELLRNQGYQLSFLGGASLDFAGKGKLLQSHGFSTVLGREALLERAGNPSYRTGWGLYDDTLLDLVYEEFNDRSRGDDPFALFTLTLDTHQPIGAPSLSVQDVLYRDGGNPILNAVAGSDVLISRFVQRIIESPYAGNTIIVVASDHLAMKNTASSLLASAERTNLFIIIDPSHPEPRRVDTPGSTLDIGPTLLPFLGFEGDLGLGRDLLNTTPETLLEGRIIRENARFWRDPIIAFWDFPILDGFLTIHADEGTASIGTRTFNTPMLIKLDSDLHTTLWFEHDGDASHESLTDLWSSAAPNVHQLLIHTGRGLLPLATSLPEDLLDDGVYLIAGRGGVVLSAQELHGNTTFTTDEIARLLGIPTPAQFIPDRVAHAGGGVGKDTYTNSFEALDLNLERGFRTFELDFVFTSDRQLVCLHDWGESFERAFGYPTDHRQSLAEFEAAVRTTSRFYKCTLDSLAAWMREHPDTTIVTDVKEDNLEALAVIGAVLPDAATRVIPQIYQPESYQPAKDLGFRKIIWTLYRYPGSNRDVLDQVDGFTGSFAVTMPKDKALTTLPRDLKERGIHTYVHTVNSPEEALLFRLNGVSEIYTDFLDPATTEIPEIW